MAASWVALGVTGLADPQRGFTNSAICHTWRYDKLPKNLY